MFGPYRAAMFSVFVLLISGITSGTSTLAEENHSVEQLFQEIRELKARVRELEGERVKALKQAYQAELSALTDNGVAAAGKTSTGHSSRTEQGFVRKIFSDTSIGGYASTEFENFEESDSTFDQHRFILNVGTQLHDRLRFYSELEFEHGANIEAEGSGEAELSIEDSDGDGVISASEASGVPVEFESSNGRGGEVSVEQAWMQYDINHNLGIRGGAVLVPVGRYNLYHDDDLSNLTDRPMVVRRVIPSTWTDAGVGLVANYEIGESVLTGEAYLLQGLNDEFSAGAGGLRDARANLESDSNNNKAVAGRVALRPSIGQELGLSGYYGSYDDSGSYVGAGAFDWNLTWSDFKLSGEAALFSIEDGVNADGDRVPKSLGGLYSELGYSFWFDELRDTFLGKSFSDPKFIASFRFNYADIDRRDADSLEGEGYVIGLAYRPEPSFVFKTEYQWNQGELERGDSDGFIGSIAIGF